MVFYEYAYYFLIYAFLGWCCEVAYAAVRHGKFVNRGFLNGPVCPIYGIGVCTVIAVLSPIQKNPYLTYFCAVMLTSVLEFVTGFLLEKLFHQKWWDYSHCPLNISGYICLHFSLLWGIGCLFVVYVLHRLTCFLVNIVPMIIGIPLLIVFLGSFAADIIYTVAQMLQFRKLVADLADFESTVRKISDRLGSEVAERMFAALERKEKAEIVLARLKEHAAELPDLEDIKKKYATALAARHTRIEKRLIQAFPHLKQNKLLTKHITIHKRKK